MSITAKVLNRKSDLKVSGAELASRSLDQPFVVSNTHDAIVNYTVEMYTSVSALSASSASCQLQVSENGEDWFTLAEVSNKFGLLSLALTRTSRSVLSGVVPFGYSVRLKSSKSGGGDVVLITAYEVTL